MILSMPLHVKWGKEGTDTPREGSPKKGREGHPGENFPLLISDSHEAQMLVLPIGSFIIP